LRGTTKERLHHNVLAIALANKLACVAWAVKHALVTRPNPNLCPQSGCSYSCAVSAAPLGFPSASASGSRPPDSLPAAPRQSTAAGSPLITAADGDDHVSASLHTSGNIE